MKVVPISISEANEFVANFHRHNKPVQGAKFAIGVSDGDRLAEGSIVLPKTENQQIKELKKLLLESAGTNVVSKAVEIAMNDDHPAQAAMIKLCMDRMLPVSMFEKEKQSRSAISITITGLGQSPEPTIIDVEGDVHG